MSYLNAVAATQLTDVMGGRCTVRVERAYGDHLPGVIEVKYTADGSTSGPYDLAKRREEVDPWGWSWRGATQGQPELLPPQAVPDVLYSALGEDPWRPVRPRRYRRRRARGTALRAQEFTTRGCWLPSNASGGSRMKRTMLVAATMGAALTSWRARGDGPAA